jgi:hypothetical protein
MRHTFYDKKSGAEVDQRSAFDERGILRDGFAMRTPVFLRDGASAPLVLTDEQKEAARETRKAMLSDAWRNPSDQFAPPAAPEAAKGDYYEQRDRRLENAWKS